MPSDLDDPQRLASLQRTALLDSPEEEVFDRLTRMAAKAMRTRVAIVSLVDDRRQFFKSATGLTHPLAAERQTPLSHSYCRHVVTSGQPLIVADARQHPLLQDNPAIEEYEAISYCGLPIVDTEGRVLGTLCAIDDKPRVWSEEEVLALQDIVRSVMAEVHLRLLSVELAETNVALQEFIAVASHDLRNPLSVILGFAAMLGEDDISAQERIEFAGKIVGQAKRAYRLVADLLEMSRLEADAVRVSRRSVYVREVVEDVISGKPRESVEVAVPADLTAFVDRDHLHRILGNLLDNALAHGCSPVSLQAERDRERVRVSVADRGDGVPHDFVPRLFTKFSRSDYSCTEGTGLGLAITAGLVKANEGSIAYEQNRPRGAKFVVDLPLGSNTTPGDPAAAA